MDSSLDDVLAPYGEEIASLAVLITPIIRCKSATLSEYPNKSDI